MVTQLKSPLAPILLILLLAFSAESALAARRVTVDQLQQILATARAGAKPDAVVAQQLAEVELSERLSDATLAKLQQNPPGPKTVEALAVLADSSVFLELPAAEIPATLPPDMTTQRQIMGRTVDYVAKTIPQLPNLLATRVTNRYDDGPQGANGRNWEVGGILANQPLGIPELHPVGVTRTVIAYNDGRETDDPQVTGAKKQPPTGLVSWGEFGPILGTVLADAARSKLAWGHWETGKNGLVAVFHYSVPREASHYELNYCCIWNQNETHTNYVQPTGGNGRTTRVGTGIQTEAPGSTAYPYRQISGYHGSISVDPATGTILRITVDADLKPTDPITRAAIMVEYGTVQIGGRDYTCPVKSVSVSVAPASVTAKATDALRFSMNSVSFEDYHRFGASTSIVASETPSASSGMGNMAAAASSSAPLPAASPAPSPVAAAAQPASAPEAPHEMVATTAPPPPPAPVEPEYTMSPATGLPPATPKESGFVLKANARLVDVGLVAYDKQGHPLVDLKQEDLEVYDNGKKQQVRLFAQAAPATAASSGPAPETENIQATSVVNQAEITAASPSLTAALVPSATVLLLDEAHLAFADLSRARAETLKFLKRISPTERVALYTMGRSGFHILVEMTTDHALLQAGLAKWSPDATAIARAQEDTERNTRHFDEVNSPEDLNNVNGNRIEVPDAQTTTDPKLRDLGSNPARDAFNTLIAVARHLALIPGHKSLVWISGDNVMVDWQDQGVGTEKQSKNLDALAQHASEALNEAHVAVYALDASAVEAGGVDASLQHANVELSQIGQDKASLPGAAAAPLNSSTASPNGRATAAMQQDIHAIQGPVRHLAESTGGRAIRKAGDIGATLDGVMSDTQATYLVSFTPDAPPDDSFHTITLKAPNRHGVKLRYRTGYQFTSEPTDARAKFQQEVWSPVDSNGIGLSAKVVSHAPAAKIQVKISMKDLAMDQHGERWTNAVDVFLVQRSDSGGSAKISGETIHLALQPSTYERMMNTGFAYERALIPDPKLGSLRFIVVDENSGRVGSVTLPAAMLQP
jgi:VWFA-related protein